MTRDVVPGDLVTAVLCPVLSLLDRLDYSVDIKHPSNPDFQLNLTYPGAESLFASLPVKMVLAQHGVIASTALAATSATQQHAVSELRRLPAQLATDLASRMAHLAPLARHVAFPADLGELEPLLARQ